MDLEHIQLVGMINRLYDGLLQFEDPSTHGALWQDVLAEVVLYAENHFRHEEQVMGELAFPRLLPHKEGHLRFRKQVSEMASRCQGRAEDLRELFTFLSAWLKHHVLEEDQQYARLIPRSESLAG